MGEMDGPAKHNLVPCGKRILNRHVKIRKCGTPCRDVAFVRLNVSHRSPGALVENIVSGKNLIKDSRVSPVPSFLQIVTGNRCVVFCGHGLTPSDLGDKPPPLESFCLCSF